MAARIASGKHTLTLGSSLKRKASNLLEEKTRRVARRSQESTISRRSPILRDKRVQNLRQPVEENQITIEKMASKKFEGWRIKLDNESCGWVKFFPKFDDYFKDHATIDFVIPQPQRGRHVGRFALKKAVEASIYSTYVAYLRKSNLASKKALSAAGFQEASFPRLKQLCMFFKKEPYAQENFPSEKSHIKKKDLTAKRKKKED